MQRKAGRDDREESAKRLANAFAELSRDLGGEGEGNGAHGVVLNGGGALFPNALSGDVEGGATRSSSLGKKTDSNGTNGTNGTSHRPRNGSLHSWKPKPTGKSNALGYQLFSILFFLAIWLMIALYHAGDQWRVLLNSERFRSAATKIVSAGFLLGFLQMMTERIDKLGKLRFRMQRQLAQKQREEEEGVTSCNGSSMQDLVGGGWDLRSLHEDKWDRNVRAFRAVCVLAIVGGFAYNLGLFAYLWEEGGGTAEMEGVRWGGGGQVCGGGAETVGGTAKL